MNIMNFEADGTFQINMVVKDPELLKLYTPLTESVHTGNSGFDLFFPQDVIIKGGAQGQKVDLMVACECFNPIRKETLQTDYQPSGYWLTPRSSISKGPLRMSNSAGVIDSSYRGNLLVPIDNLNDTDFLIEKGSRLFQIVNPLMFQNIKLNIVEKLSDTERGTGGFGSTGK